MLQTKHSAILSTFIKVPLVIKIFVLSIFEWPFYTGFTVLEIWFEIITIHHERPCRIEISHPRGRKFNQGRGLPSPWLNSDPSGEISLSYIDRLMMDRFSPTFWRFFCQNIKTHWKPEISNFLLVGFTLFLSSWVFLSGIKMGVNIVCALLLPGKHSWSIS